MKALDNLRRPRHFDTLPQDCAVLVVYFDFLHDAYAKNEDYSKGL